ncbi:probable receptor-like protein kinase At5g38990 [Prosopis cineraria]|uniref:probable receptor-like protein kinase At5g38990 n=1 Tax=Prosopis cineraria TaxID=364024 RepID=UPI00240FE72D|nr:probable receptor-like protein kinase At5g38990 [Prosopis cineraria]
MGFLTQCFRGSASTKRPSATVEELSYCFSLSQLQAATNNFDESRLIDETCFSKVYRGHISIDGQPMEIAAKLMHRYEIEQRSNFENEILFLCQLHHPNLVSLLGFCDDEFKDEMMVVYEFMPNGSLHHQLHKRDSNSPALSWKTRLEISIGVARALHYLHVGTKRTIVHCNVKPSIILLDDHWSPKLTDFGISLKGPKYSSKEKAKEVKRPIAGTLGYTDPAYLHSSMISSKCDVFSFGMLLVELICRENISKILLTFVDEFALQSIANPDERPDMGEVEVQLERALQLQQEADAHHSFRAFLI